MNAPTENDVPADLLDQLDDEWTVEADMKRMEMWHDVYGHVVVTDNGEELAVQSWDDPNSTSGDHADAEAHVESQEDAATRMAEFALELEREGSEEELSIIERIPALRNLFK